MLVLQQIRVQDHLPSSATTELVRFTVVEIVDGGLRVVDFATVTNSKNNRKKQLLLKTTFITLVAIIMLTSLTSKRKTLMARHLQNNKYA